MEPNLVVVTSGTTFAASAPNGNIRPRTADGFYAHDTRYLTAFRLTIEGQEPRAVAGGRLNHSIVTFYGQNRGRRHLPAGSISVVRDRYVAQGLHEDISLVNHSPIARSLRLELSFDADFADIFEVRRGKVTKAGRSVVLQAREGQHLCLAYRRRRFHRESWISFSAQPALAGKTAAFDITLEPKGLWKTCVTILPVMQRPPAPMQCVEAVLGQPFGEYRLEEKSPLSVLARPSPRAPLQNPLGLETDHAGFRQAYQQAIADLRSLLIEEVPGHYILAAGLPWFMAIFGRDSIISALQTKLLGPELMVGTLYTLASLQATAIDDFREAQPGKIPHEVRRGELSLLEEVPHSRYYGSVDATPLFLTLLEEACQWTGDEDLLRRLLPAAEAALRWIEGYGDVDGDGFVEYQCRSRWGLRNQGWKDSADSISFASGELAESPLALAEVQGYVYDAKRKMAEVYRLLGRAAEAQKLEGEADRLAQRFHQAFWMPEEGYIALALDRRKRPVDSIASNAGHCLWSGIVDSSKAAQVVARLMAPDMFSGWGIRTLSTAMARYHPLSYHNGSVWPHDNSLIAAGMARYGYFEEARRVALALIDAANASPNHRLPELFGGYPRREYSFPVPYPAANEPQAWAAGAVVYLLETLLGVVPAGDRLLRAATRGSPLLSLRGVPYRGSRWDL